MRGNRRRRGFKSVFALVLFAGCQPARPPGPSLGAVAPRSVARPGVTEVAPGDVPRAAAGQTVYVPVYPHVYGDDTARPFNLAVTLAVRNTDRAEPLVLSAVRYYDSGGRPVRDYVKAPLRLAPMAAMEFFVKESDLTGGSAASFLVEWVAAKPVSDPVVEAVMIGTAMNQGIALTSPGRVVGGPPP